MMVMFKHQGRFAKAFYVVTQKEIDMAHTVDEVVAKYVALREEKARVTKEIDEKVSALQAWLRIYLDQTKQEGCKTARGTVYKQVKRTASIENIDEFEVYADENPRFWKRSLNTTEVLESLDAGNPPPPGVNVASIEVIGVRA